MIALLLVTKNEHELLDWNLRHHLASGFDHVVVADNRSTDATAEVARGAGPDVTHVVFDDFHERQTWRHRMLHRLREHHDVEWAAIADTDEFFWSPTPLRDLLAAVPDDVVAVNFDAKLFLPTALDPAEGPPIVRRTYRSASNDSPLHTSYSAGKTIYRAEWLASIPVDHWCARHEHWCAEVPHEQYRHEERLVHHYMIQDEDQFVEKVTRLINWAKPPTSSRRARLKWSLTPKPRRPLPPWSEPWKKVWWGVFQSGGEQAVRDYFRSVYTIGADSVAAHVASGDLVHYDAFARHVRATLHLDAGTIP